MLVDAQCVTFGGWLGCMCVAGERSGFTALRVFGPLTISCVRCMEHQMRQELWLGSKPTHTSNAKHMVGLAARMGVPSLSLSLSLSLTHSLPPSLSLSAIPHLFSDDSRRGPCWATGPLQPRHSYHRLIQTRWPCMAPSRHTAAASTPPATRHTALAAAHAAAPSTSKEC